jgi:hypothetical protein
VLNHLLPDDAVLLAGEFGDYLRDRERSEWTGRRRLPARRPHLDPC